MLSHASYALRRACERMQDPAFFWKPGIWQHKQSAKGRAELQWRMQTTADRTLLPVVCTGCHISSMASNGRLRAGRAPPRLPRETLPSSRPAGIRILFPRQMNDTTRLRACWKLEALIIRSLSIDQCMACTIQRRCHRAPCLTIHLILTNSSG